MPNGVKVMAILVARPGKTVELKKLLSNLLTRSRAEPGNLSWEIWQDRADSNRFLLDELYANEEAVAVHRGTPHFKNYLGKINDLAERTPFVLDPVEFN